MSTPNKSEQFSLKKTMKLAFSRQTYYSLLLMSPLSMYVTYFGGQIALSDLWAVIVAPLLAAILTKPFHLFISEKKIYTIDKLFENAEKNAKQIKIALINYPLFEAKVTVFSWILIGLLSYIFLIIFIEINNFVVVGVVIVTFLAMLFSGILNFFSTERYALQLLQHPKVSKVVIDISEIKMLNDITRKFMLIFGVSIFPLITLGFFTILSANFNVQFANLVFHIIAIIFLMIFAIAFLIYEGYKNNKISIALMKKDIAELSTGRISNENIPMNISSELGFIAQNLNAFRMRLYNIIATITETSVSVDQSSQQIEQSTAGISSMAKEQLENVQTISSLLEEITTIVKETAGETEKTLQETRVTAESSQKGSMLLKKIIQEVQDINNNIVLVESIAGQTNLLALNASIEAARSNERGKGFAVVAVEISKLAENSSLSSKEIIVIVKNALQNSEHAEEIFSALASKMQIGLEMFQGITLAAQQEEQGITQVSTGMHQLKEIATNNTNASQDLAQVAGDMKHFSERLAKEVAFFKLVEKT